MRFLGLYDPVNKTVSSGKDTEIPSNVRNVGWVAAKPFVPGGKRSREGWERPEYTWAKGKISPVRIAATHSAFSGAPTYSTEAFGVKGVPSLGGSLPKGYTKKRDIDGAIKADQTIREAARAAGVPIRLLTRADYDFDDLPVWDMKHQASREGWADLG